MFAAVMVVDERKTTPPMMLVAESKGDADVTAILVIGNALSDASGSNTVCGLAPLASRVSAGICSLPVTIDGPAGTVLGQPVTAPMIEPVAELDEPAQ